MKRRNTMLLKVGLIIIMSLIGLSLVFVALAVDTSDFTHRNNLSRTGKHDLQSGPPQVARKEATIAVVWSDGFNTQVDTKDFGHIYLKTANEDDDYWRAKTPVFSATNDTWGGIPALTFDPQASADTVHVVWSEGTGCNGIITNCRFQRIRYKRCDVSGDVNSCSGIQTVAQTAVAGISYVNPSITDDGNGGLHVVWVRQGGGGNQLWYSRGAKSGNSVTWSSESSVAAVSSPEEAKILASNGVLHLVWDTNSEVNHFRDTTPGNNSLSPAGGIETFAGSGKYANEDPENPTVEALGDWVVVGFDVEDSASPNTIGLFWEMSGDNGDNWGGTTLSIPDQGSIRDFFRHPDDTDVGLKPSFAITSTGTVTRLHAVWHEYVRTNPSGFPIFRYRVRFSDLSLTAPIFGVPDCPNVSTLCWSEPVTATHVMSITGKDTTDAQLVITELSGGDGTGHIAFLQDLDDTPTNEDQIDVYYLGGIAGTIDPAYILDEFVGPNPADPNQFKKVTPTDIITSVYPVNMALNYRIAFTNTGELVAVKVGITDTLPGGVNYNGDLVTSGNMGPPQAVYIAATKVISWFGNVRPGERVEITFSVQTTPDNVPPTVITNRLDMWNIGVKDHKPFLTRYARTFYATSLIHLPVVYK